MVSALLLPVGLRQEWAMIPEAGGRSAALGPSVSAAIGLGTVLSDGPPSVGPGLLCSLLSL